MFDDNMFEKWLNEKAGEVFDKVGREEAIRPDEMIILVLKAQVNHFTHLDTDLRKDMRDLREDMSAEIKDLREDMNTLREDMEKRFNRTQWLIGTGVAFLTVLMSFYQFLQ